MRVHVPVQRVSLPVLYAELDDAATRIRNGLAADGWSVSCRPGCANCCHQQLIVTNVEARALVEDVHARAGAAGLAELRGRAVVQHERVNSVPRRQYHRLREPCLFLDVATQRCTVYRVRPVVCRLHFSVDDPRKCAGDLKETRVVNVKPLVELAGVALAFLGADLDVTLGDATRLNDERVAELAPTFASLVIAAIDARGAP